MNQNLMRRDREPKFDQMRQPEYDERRCGARLECDERRRRVRMECGERRGDGEPECDKRNRGSQNVMRGYVELEWNVIRLDRNQNGMKAFVKGEGNQSMNLGGHTRGARRKLAISIDESMKQCRFSIDLCRFSFLPPLIFLLAPLFFLPAPTSCLPAPTFCLPAPISSLPAPNPCLPCSFLLLFSFLPPLKLDAAEIVWLSRNP